MNVRVYRDFLHVESKMIKLVDLNKGNTWSHQIPVKTLSFQSAAVHKHVEEWAMQKTIIVLSASLTKQLPNIPIQ